MTLAYEFLLALKRQYVGWIAVFALLTAFELVSRRPGGTWRGRLAGLPIGRCRSR